MEAEAGGATGTGLCGSHVGAKAGPQLLCSKPTSGPYSPRRGLRLLSYMEPDPSLACCLLHTRTPQPTDAEAAGPCQSIVLIHGWSWDICGRHLKLAHLSPQGSPRHSHCPNSISVLAGVWIPIISSPGCFFLLGTSRGNPSSAPWGAGFTPHTSPPGAKGEASPALA